ncbi:hypothetical protein MTBBW1_600018 [Desulfamplus magnetovallimortis]|uniref:Uncharacterized protein n=1 Tax=Desulfamplus magnetovallimortis TaxID=1246637 RepID=A0A1W1HII7_9BACT|nr:hypothetical protein MTBBW1_600018 [Desulfamplus magnetovallimortis]
MDMAVIQPPPNMKICIHFHGKEIMLFFSDYFDYKLDVDMNQN